MVKSQHHMYVQVMQKCLIHKFKLSKVLGIGAHKVSQVHYVTRVFKLVHQCMQLFLQLNKIT